MPPVALATDRAAHPARALALEVGDLGDSLFRAQADLEHFLTAVHVDARAAYRANLVFEELTTNALKYGGEGAAPNVVRVRVGVEPDAVVLELRDRGVAFDPTTVRPTPPVSSIEDAPVGGLGLALVRKVAASLDYRRVNDENRTVVRIATERA